MCENKPFSPATAPRYETISCLMLWFSTWAHFPPLGTLDDVWRYFGFSHLRGGGGCYWLLVSGGQGCWSVHHTAQLRTQDSFHCGPSLGPKCPQDWGWEILASCHVSWPSLLLFGLLCTACKIFLHPFKITDQVLPSLLFFFFFFLMWTIF